MQAQGFAFIHIRRAQIGEPASGQQSAPECPQPAQPFRLIESGGGETYR